MHGKHLAWTILQPLVASVGMVGGAFICVRWVLRPVYCMVIRRIGSRASRGYFLLTLILTLSGLVTISNFTGSSMLFGAYVAGCVLRSLDTAVEDFGSFSSFQDAFDTHVSRLTDFIFVPLFFASIGMAVPFLSLWKGSVIWKGIVYSLVMWLGKAVTGLCIIAWPDHDPKSLEIGEEIVTVEAQTDGSALGEVAVPSTIQAQNHGTVTSMSNRKGLSNKRRLPVYPALLISLAMVSRGEIALLIAQLALPTLGEENYLVVMWASVLCTLIGAVSTGQLVHRRFSECTSANWG